MQANHIRQALGLLGKVLKMVGAAFVGALSLLGSLGLFVAMFQHSDAATVAVIRTWPDIFPKMVGAELLAVAAFALLKWALRRWHFRLA